MSPLFRWECGPSGEIAWVEGVPRGPLIGRSLANPGEHNGVDRRIQRAFAVRAPFRDAMLSISGEGPASGEWKLSGVPAFEPADGRFAGYRGVGIRSAETVEDAPHVEDEEPLDEDALRELIHELRTPLHAIIGFAEIIDGQYLGPADHSYRERAAEIVAQARLLLSAIEDLDIAAQLRSSSAAVEGSTDLNALLKAMTPELKERAGNRHARIDVDAVAGAGDLQPRPQRPGAADAPLLLRTDRCRRAARAAGRRRRLRCRAMPGDAQPAAGVARSERCPAVWPRTTTAPTCLPRSFSLKLARGIAQTAGGDLRVSGEKLALVLARRRT